MEGNIRTLLELDYSIKLPEKKDYGIGAIGCGGIMNHAHLPAYRQGGFRVVACCDIREEAARSTAERFGIPRFFVDYRRLLDLPEVEIVDIAIHQEGRVEIVRDCASAGKHILLQKPFAHRWEDALEMVNICQEKGVKLMINQQARWAPGHRLARLLIDSGLLGTVFHATHHVRGNQDSGWAAQTPNFLIIDHGIHYLDLMRFWIGRQPQRVCASTVRMPGQTAIAPLVYSINLVFDGHLMANLWFNDVVQGQDSFYEFTIDGTGGLVRGTATEVTIALKDAPFPCVRLKLKGSWFPDAFAGTMGELMRAIQQDDEPQTSGKDNLDTLKIALAAVQSSETHQPVALDSGSLP